MCTAHVDPTVRQTTDAILADIVKDRLPFTVREITKYVRFDLPGINVKHADIRALVVDAFHSGRLPFYNRMPANLPDVCPQPLVYFLMGNDLTSYGLEDMSPIMVCQRPAELVPVALSHSRPQLGMLNRLLSWFRK